MSFARNVSRLKFKSAEILHLKQQLAAYRTSMKKQKITELEDRLATVYESCSNLQDSTPIDIIFGDICHNPNVDPHGRRYSVEMISWACEIQDLSTVAYETIRAILPLPSDRLLRIEFLNCKLRVQQSLTNLSLIDELLRVWSLSNRVDPETSHSIQAILSVDALSIHPMITIYEMGKSKASKISRSFHCLASLSNLFSIHESSRNLFISTGMQHTHHYLSIKPSHYHPSLNVVQFM
jgi:hypothetical protein